METVIKFEGQGGIGSIFSRLTLEGPLKKTKVPSFNRSREKIRHRHTSARSFYP